MLAQSPVAGDTRVVREATSLVRAGHHVTVVGRGVPQGWRPPDGVVVLSGRVPSGLGRRRVAGRQGVVGVALRTARWLLLPEHRRRVESTWCARVRQLVRDEAPDAVHAHDFNTLELATEVCRATGAFLVYDSHEFWTGRPRVGRPTPLHRRRDAAAEGCLGRSADAVITVGEGVADALRAKYGWSHVSVVRNTFPLPSGGADGRLPEGRGPAGLLYAGRLAADRELEVVARASDLVDLPVTLIGPADETWLERFDARRATVLPARELGQVDALLVQAGVALVTHSDRWLNHRLALPTKLFHAVSAGVPVLATDVGELGRVVREHGLGELYRPGDAEDLARAVARLRADYPAAAARVRAAAGALSWARDEAVLLGIYADLPRGRTPSITG